VACLINDSKKGQAMFVKICILLISSLILGGCSSSRVVVERLRPASIILPKEARTIEVQKISGSNSSSFSSSLNQYLIENSSLIVIYSQGTSDLVDVRLRGDRNKQNYKQADLIITGSIQEEVVKMYGSNGEEQYAVTSRPFLQLINSSTGQVILSKYFVGTSRSLVQPQQASLSYDGYTDGVLSARNVALEKFVTLFSPQKTWLEIDLYKFTDKERFQEIHNLIGYGHYDKAGMIARNYFEKLNDNRTEKGKVLFSLAVIESLIGEYSKARDLLYQAHHLYPEEDMLNYLKRIEQLEIESNKISMNR